MAYNWRGGGALISGELISRGLITGCIFWFKGRWSITGEWGGLKVGSLYLRGLEPDVFVCFKVDGL